MVLRARLVVLGFGLIGFAAALVATQPRPGKIDDLAGLTGSPARGAPVFAAAGCASCHMAPGATGDAQQVLSGGMALASPFGTFFAPNISTDATHGIGDWTLEEFTSAIRDGISPDGQHYFPALPYTAYAKMTGQDVVDLWAFVQTLPPSAEPSRPHEVGFPFNIRRSIGGWKLLFASTDWHMTEPATPQIERGRYIVEALAHCAECHTPRNALGGLDSSRWMAGAPSADGKGRVPNITPAKLTWSEGEIVTYLTTGFTPDYDSVGGHMAHVVENISQLQAADVQAVAAYLKALAAIE